MKAPELWRNLRPSERLTTSMLILLTTLALLARPVGWMGLLLAFTALLGLVVGVTCLRPGARLPWLREFAPVVAVLGAFLLLQPLVGTINPHRWDTVLAAADARWLAGLAAAWRNAFGRPPLFTDLVYLAYVSFYLLPLSVAALVRARSGSRAFEGVAFPILLGFFLSFLGYFLWPAEGPRVPAHLEAETLGGGGISHGIRTFLRAAESTTLDAFPSGHTALSIVPAFLASRVLGWKAWPFWLWALAIIFATVYISAHYVMDVFGGLILAVLTLVCASPLHRLFGHTPEA